MLERESWPLLARPVPPRKAARSRCPASRRSQLVPTINPMVRARFLIDRRSDLHDARLWSQFGYVNRQLTSVVRDLLGSARLGPRDVVLDFGCADRPYRALLPNGIAYIGADLPGNPSADVEIGVDGHLPLSDATVDLVLSTQVLEHVEEPSKYLSECFRVLKPGGSLLLTTHGIMYYHRDPEDYWRWTCAGLRRVLERHGFEVMELRGLLGLGSAALQLLQDGTVWRLPRRLRRLYVVLMQWFIVLVDRMYSEQSRAENSWTIAIRALRKERAVLD